MSGADWRPIAAALANPHTRAAYAGLVLGDTSSLDGLAPARRRNVEETLVTSGLASHGADGELTIVPDAFTRLLAAQPQRPKPVGVERFLDVDGRIARYPSLAADRDALLAHVLDDVLGGEETVTEPELNARLARWTDDIPVLRRALVDAALLDRTPSGSAYVRR